MHAPVQSMILSQWHVPNEPHTCPAFATHVQALLTQVSAPGQAFPQPPQLLASVVGSTQLPLQAI
jgi:hypothetical protein